jgi:DNA-binding Lrp family transcriptional regulator
VCQSLNGIWQQKRKKNLDIDIDFADRTQILSKITHRIAVLTNGKNHNTGVYVTEIPHNPITNQATIDYQKAEERGYFKIDFLNVNIYKDITSEEELQKLINQEPLWELLEYKEFTDNLFHVSGHSDIMSKLKPKSLEELACALAIIRPAKRYLANCDWETIHREVWIKPETGNEYYWKKSHSFSYALAVIVHMNQLCNKLT